MKFCNLQIELYHVEILRIKVGFDEFSWSVQVSVENGCGVWYNASRCESVNSTIDDGGEPNLCMFF